MRFSIVTPTWNRYDGRLERCIDSVDRQTFRDFEHIVVDDGSTDGTVELGILDWPRFRYLRIDHQGRVAARNVGMREAKGDWICWLDSDDAWDPMYLATFSHFIDEDPDWSLWVCGVVQHGIKKDADGIHLVPAWTKLRTAWRPPVDSNGVHTLFNSGRIGTGMFVFRRECLDTIGYMPDSWNHNQIADGIDEWLGFPRGATGYGTDKSVYPKGLVGNPFGDDHAVFQKLCLNYRVQLIDACLYVHYTR